MKRMTLLTTLSLAFASNIALANSVTFTIEQVKNDKGTILAQLFKGATNYKAGKAVSAQQVKAKQGSISITFNNLEPGEYAIRYFHDENNNGKLETNMFANPEVNLQTAISALVVLVVCGAVAGLVPATKAARVNPIVALHAE